MVSCDDEEPQSDASIACSLSPADRTCPVAGTVAAATATAVEAAAEAEAKTAPATAAVGVAAAQDTPDSARNTVNRNSQTISAGAWRGHWPQSGTARRPHAETES